MSDQKMKPVWRMNTGNGVPLDFKVNGEVLTSNGQVKLLECADWDKRLAYQTTRTKAAKYDWVECPLCKGCGGFCFKKSDLTWIESCKTCRGAGIVKGKVNGN